MTEAPATQLLLLVEDEALLRIETEDYLTEQGFTIISSVNGSDGISELEIEADRFSAVVTMFDLGVARMDGQSLDARANWRQQCR